MATGTIYLITNKATGMHYVGRTTLALPERCARHLDDAFRLRRKTRLCVAFRRYGAKSFTIRALKRNVPVRSLGAEENRYMDKYSTMHPHGYNMVAATSGAGRSRKGYYVERTITVKESVTYYRQGKPALKLTRVYRETRRGRSPRLPGSRPHPRLPK